MRQLQEMQYDMSAMTGIEEQYPDIDEAALAENGLLPTKLKNSTKKLKPKASQAASTSKKFILDDLYL